MENNLRRLGRPIGKPKAEAGRYRKFFETMPWWMVAFYIGFTWWGMKYLEYSQTEVEWSVPDREQLTVAEGIFLGKSERPSRRSFPYQILLQNGDILTFSCWPNAHSNFCLEKTAEERSGSLSEFHNLSIQIKYFYLQNRKNSLLYNVAMEVIIGDQVLRDYNATKEEFTNQLEREKEDAGSARHLSWGYGVLMFLLCGPGLFFKIRLSISKRVRGEA